ncbi:MAG: U32 family peptidase [Eubacteriales bacterium]|nr:U32 family peptidase [Eubacteriales bacterium]
MPNCELVVSILNREYIKLVCELGADAVDMHLKGLGDETALEACIMEQAKLAHSFGKKYYLSIDFFAHNIDIEWLRNHFDCFLELGVDQVLDAIVVYDPGVFRLVKHMLPDVNIHIGSEINVTNEEVCKIWKQLGATRIRMAQVLSENAVVHIAEGISNEVEIEPIIYGVPCISYSGRKLLTGFLEECHHIENEKGKYYVVEEQRQEVYYPVREDARGTYVYDSRERNWLEMIPCFVSSGIRSFLLEGTKYDRQALVDAVLACRQVLDAIKN